MKFAAYLALIMFAGIAALSQTRVDPSQIRTFEKRPSGYPAMIYCGSGVCQGYAEQLDIAYVEASRETPTRATPCQRHAFRFAEAGLYVCFPGSGWFRAAMNPI